MMGFSQSGSTVQSSCASCPVRSFAWPPCCCEPQAQTSLSTCPSHRFYLSVSHIFTYFAYLCLRFQYILTTLSHSHANECQFAAECPISTASDVYSSPASLTLFPTLRPARHSCSSCHQTSEHVRLIDHNILIRRSLPPRLRERLRD